MEINGEGNVGGSEWGLARVHLESCLFGGNRHLNGCEARRLRAIFFRGQE